RRARYFFASTLVAAAGALEDGRVNVVRGEQDGAVTVQHVEPARMGAAEAEGVAQALQVAQGRRVGVAGDVVVHADVHALVIAAVAAGGVVIGVEVLFAGQEGVAGAVGDGGHLDGAALEDDAGEIGRVRPAIAGAVPRGVVGRAAEQLVGGLIAAVAGVIGP